MVEEKKASSEVTKKEGGVVEKTTKDISVEKNMFDGVQYDDLVLSMEAMLAAGVHFGHPKARRNPKMRDFIFSTRNNINIIDLGQSVPLMKEALKFLRKIASSEKKILFVGTKKQSHRFVVDLAKYTNNPYVIDRWLGGTLTNYGNIRKRVRHMSQLGTQIESGDLSRYTKFEQLKKQEEYDKLQRRMGGIVDMDKLPGAVFVTDIKSDHLAVREAVKLGIPVVGLADTNVNPEDVDYPIPANDDALSSLMYVLSHVAKVLKSQK